MNEGTQDRVQALVEKLPSLTDGQLYWLERVLLVFESAHEFQPIQDDFVNMDEVRDFGDAMRIHHSISDEPFTKDKFEYVLARVLRMSGHDVKLTGRVQRGHDISVDGVPISLKTQADKDIKRGSLWISKFMELGKGEWSNDPDDLVRLREAFLEHMHAYDRIFTLRTLKRGPNWLYELVEIPKELLLSSEDGELEMKFDSRQNPKPGYCHVTTEDGDVKYQLYFNGGTERKLQIKRLDKDYCIVHATWSFTVPPE